MARFSESELQVIQANPIKDEFKIVLSIFKSTYPIAKVTDSPFYYEKLLTDLGREVRTILFQPS